MVSRLLYDKGVVEFINASRSLIDNNCFADFTLIGDYDINNPSSLDPKIINHWKSFKNTNYLGFKKDIKNYLINSDVVILPSYREGMPKILLEASSIGRAIITTNVPGCKECVIDNKNGFVIEPKNTEKIVLAMMKFVTDKNLIHTMGIESRKIAEKEYSIYKVIRDHLSIYDSILKHD